MGRMDLQLSGCSVFCSRDEQTDKLLWKVVSVMTRAVEPWKGGQELTSILRNTSLHPRAGLGPRMLLGRGGDVDAPCSHHRTVTPE